MVHVRDELLEPQDGAAVSSVWGLKVECEGGSSGRREASQYMGNVGRLHYREAFTVNIYIWGMWEGCIKNKNNLFM